jgi:hypothetical protein
VTAGLPGFSTRTWPADACDPLNVSIREDRIVPRLDRWLADLFDKDVHERTLDTLDAAQQASGLDDPAGCPPSIRSPTRIASWPSTAPPLKLARTR